MRELMLAVGRMVRDIRSAPSDDEASKANVERYDRVWEAARKRRDQAFTIETDPDGTLRVRGRAVERMVIQTDWDNDEAIVYLQHRFERLGLDDALAKAGARNGDYVRILGYELEFTGGDDAYDEPEGDDEDLLWVDAQAWNADPELYSEAFSPRGQEIPATEEGDE